MKKTTIKDFDQFLVEASLRKSKGLPSDFMSSAEEEARKNLGVRIDQPGPTDIKNLISQSTSMMQEGTKKEVKERYDALTELAKEVIMEEFGFVLEASEKPVVLDIRLVKSVISEMPELRQKAETPEEAPEHEDEEPQSQEVEPQSQEAQSQEEEQEEDDFFSFFDEEETPEEEEEREEEEVRALSNKDVAFAIDKKKLLNTITQGAGKATKDIIKLSKTVEDGVAKIFGKEKGKKILEIWGKISDEADKLDWTIPVGMKQAMFKGAPEGIAGATSVHFIGKRESASNELIDIQYLKENSDFSRIVIRAYGTDFPMLIHEATKGVRMLLLSAAIKKDPELAKEIKRATSSYRDEAEEFRYGPLANLMFNKFVNACAGADRFPNAVERIFGALALDKERGGQFTDEQFLEITKDMFSSFDKVENRGKIDFVLNGEKFASSHARTKIEKILADFNRVWEDYEEQLRNWEMEQKFGGEQEGEYGQKEEEPESEIDKLVKQTLYGGEEEEDAPKKDYKDMSVAEIQDEITKAVAVEDYELAGYLKNTFLKGEAKRVWDIELKRINESRARR